MVRSLSCRALIAALLSLLTVSAAADSNVRPHFSLGPTMPFRWGVVDHGKALGLGIEVETSPRFSQVAEFDASWLDTDAPPSVSASDSYIPTPLLYPSQWTEATLLSGRFGLRVHMATTAKVRPYLQAGVGVRSVSGSARYLAFPTGNQSPPKSGSHVDGATMHMRFGFTTAGYRGAGLFIDGTAETLIRNPRDFALFPVRLGITLP